MDSLFKLDIIIMTIIGVNKFVNFCFSLLRTFTHTHTHTHINGYILIIIYDDRNYGLWG